MLKASLFAITALALFALAACESAPAPTAADAPKMPSDPGIRVSGYVQAGGTSAIR